MKGFNNPPEAITRSYIATLVKVFVLAAVLVTAVQSSALAENMGITIVINRSGQAIVARSYRHNNDNWSNWKEFYVPSGSKGQIQHTHNSGVRYHTHATYRFKFSDGTYRVIEISTDSNSTVYID